MLEKSKVSPKNYIALKDFEEFDSLQDKSAFQTAEMNICSVSKIVGNSRKTWVERSRSLSNENENERFKPWLRSSGLDGGSEVNAMLYFQEAEVELVTGRTHQIRGQLSSPSYSSLQSLSSLSSRNTVHVAGDNNYLGPTTCAVQAQLGAPGTHKESPNLALLSSYLEFEDLRGERVQFELTAKDAFWRGVV